MQAPRSRPHHGHSRGPRRFHQRRGLRGSTLTTLAITLALALAGLWRGVRSSAVLPAPKTTVLLERNRDGEVLQGSMERLLKAARAGAELRVGWSFPFGTDRALEHWADAGFLTIWNGHVFAQIRDIHTQGPVIDQPAIHLGVEPHGWGAILGSNGTLTSVFSGMDPAVEQVHVTWAVAR